MVSRHTSFSRLAAYAAATLGLVALAHAAEGTAPVTVPTLVVGGSSTNASLHIEGTLQALQQSTVAAQVGGNVLQLAVKAGDRVKAGALLARIDDRDLQAGLAGGDAGVAQAAAAVAQAQQNATRTRDLRTQGFVSQAAVDVADTQLQAAQAAHRQAQAGRSQAALARSFAAVTAPFDAVVLATHVEAGDLATPGRPITTLYAPGKLRAVVQLPLSRSALARSASAVEVILADGRRVVPTSRTEGPGTDAVSQTVEWRLNLPADAVAGLAPGQPVQVRFAGAATPVAPVASTTSPASATQTRLVVPGTAVLHRGELTAVYAAQEGRFVLKAVRLGSRQGDGVEVLAGLKAGERIAADAVRAGLAGAAPATR
jgi:RND family efflux transporter MFP subunit